MKGPIELSRSIRKAVQEALDAGYFVEVYTLDGANEDSGVRYANVRLTFEDREAWVSVTP